MTKWTWPGHIARAMLIVSSALGLISGARADTPGPTSVKVLYHAPFLRETHQEIARMFMQQHPEIRIDLLVPAENYADLTQKVLRAGLAGDGPDVAFQGLDLAALFVERNLAVALDPFVKAEPEWERMGYLPAMLSLGRHGGALYGLPFSISTPMIFFNADLVRQAGGNPDSFPGDWRGINALAARIKALGTVTQGLYYDYTISGNWMYLALLNSAGGSLMAEASAPAGDEAGLYALQTLHGFGEAGMLDMPRSQAQQAFEAGTLGIYVGSSARLGDFLKAAGTKFALGTAPFPLMSADGKLPAGGNVAMILTKDAAKQKAAWEYVKFATGPAGQTVMAKNTGYMPGNEIAAKEPAFLGTFYAENPAYLTSIRQMPAVTLWQTFPGKNALKIAEVIKTHMQAAVTMQKPPEAILKAMNAEVSALLKP